MCLCTPALWGDGVFSRSSEIFLLLGDRDAVGSAAASLEDAALQVNIGTPGHDRSIGVKRVHIRM